MSFHDVRLPDDIERGAVGGPRFKTRVLGLQSGFEQRNVDWAQSRGEWDIAYGLMSMEDDNQLATYIHLVRDFFYARQGRANGFRFKDWSDFQIGDFNNPTTNNQLIGLGDNTTTQFQVFKRYSSGGINHDRTLYKLVSGTVVVMIDNVVQSTPANYSVNLDTGLITFTSAPSATGGTGPGGEEVVSVALEFDVPVRFDDDQLRISVQTFQAGSIPQIPIVELRIAT